MLIVGLSYLAACFGFFCWQIFRTRDPFWERYEREEQTQELYRQQGERMDVLELERMARLR